MDRQKLIGKSNQEISKIIEEEVAKYKKKYLEKETDTNVLKELEQKIIDKQDKFNEELKERKYPLTTEVSYDGEVYRKNQIFSFILYFINKLDVKWEMTLGMYELAKFWKDVNNKEIPYGVFDSTLRVLGQCSFKGSTEWKQILAINEYMKSNHNEYFIDTSMLIFYSQIHQEIMNRIDIVSPIGQTSTNEVHEKEDTDK